MIETLYGSDAMNRNNVYDFQYFVMAQNALNMIDDPVHQYQYEQKTAFKKWLRSSR